MRSKELSVELRDRIVARHRSEEEYQDSSPQMLSLAREVTKNPMDTLAEL